MTGAVALGGCPSYGIVDDGTSVSWGATNQGALIRPARLPARGQGYAIPPRWNQRGLSFGTDELVELIAHVGARMHGEARGSVLGVGDLSPRRGGPSAWHRSHQTGRDVDLLLFATDATGKPIQLEQMIPFDADGTAALAATGADGAGEDAGAPATIRFDVARNWRLVRALVENPIAQVQYIFLYEPLQQRVLDHASAIGEPYDVILRASHLMLQPGDSLPHNDHMHVRLFCAHTDRALGCVDRGRIRWVKKHYKYASWRRGGAGAAARLGAAPGAQMASRMWLPLPAGRASRPSPVRGDGLAWWQEADARP